MFINKTSNRRVLLCALSAAVLCVFGGINSFAIAATKTISGTTTSGATPSVSSQSPLELRRPSERLDFFVSEVMGACVVSSNNQMGAANKLKLLKNCPLNPVVAGTKMLRMGLIGFEGYTNETMPQRVGVAFFLENTVTPDRPIQVGCLAVDPASPNDAYVGLCSSAIPYSWDVVQVDQTGFKLRTFPAVKNGPVQCLGRVAASEQLGLYTCADSESQIFRWSRLSGTSADWKDKSLGFQLRRQKSNGGVLSPNLCVTVPSSKYVIKTQLVVQSCLDSAQEQVFRFYSENTTLTQVTPSLFFDTDKAFGVKSVILNTLVNQADRLPPAPLRITLDPGWVPGESFQYLENTRQLSLKVVNACMTDSMESGGSLLIFDSCVGAPNWQRWIYVPALYLK